ncbi:MAG: hypothetical protein ACRELC_11330, partial [Gemmatimonadota bacterium]
EERCAWLDLGPTLRGDGAARYDDLACAERRAFHAVFWHLADPLWLVPGNERRSEHLARRVWDRLQDDAESGYGVSWGSDLRELLLRYGWPAGWDVAWRRDPGMRTESAVQSHREPRAQQHVARAEWVWGAEPLEIERWELDDERPRSTWAPPYGALRPLPHQLARFRRGDTLVVVAAFDPPDSLARCPLDAALFLTSATEVRASAPARPGAGAERRVFRVDTPLPDPGRGERTLVGLEARCADWPAAARARYDLDPRPEDARLSGLLLLDPAEPLPGTLDAAIPRARGSSAARARDTLAVYWEWYGSAPAAGPVSVTLSLSREGKSFWRKAVEWIGLADRRDETVGLRWEERLEASASGIAPRSVTLALPDLPRGRYRLMLEIRPPRGGAATASRELLIEDDDR